MMIESHENGGHDDYDALMADLADIAHGDF